MVVLVIVAVVVIVGVVAVVLRWDRYRGTRGAEGGSNAARPTGEVFVDPESGRRMRVWQDTKTGRREYRPDDPSVPSP
jgi:hypothetical protein